MVGVACPSREPSGRAGVGRVSPEQTFRPLKGSPQKGKLLKGKLELSGDDWKEIVNKIQRLLENISLSSRKCSQKSPFSFLSAVDRKGGQ